MAKYQEQFNKYMSYLESEGLFNSEEIIKLGQKLRLLDSKLTCDPSLLETYRRVTEVEVNFIKEIKRRRKTKIKESDSDKKNEATADSDKKDEYKDDYFFRHKVIEHFQTGLNCFPEDYELNLQYFNFIKLFSDYEKTTESHIKKLLTNFGSKRPELYRKTASFYYCIKNFEEARKILLDGQKNYPQNIDIYLDLLELEFRSGNRIGVGERMKGYVDLIVENQIGRRFLEETILLLETQMNLRSVAEYAVEKLLSTYSNEVESYMFAAKWELKADQSLSKTADQLYSMAAVERGIQQLKKGMLALPADQKDVIWKCYIEFNKKVVAENPKPNAKLDAYLQRALQEAENANIKLTEEHFVDWVAYHQDSRGIVLPKLEQAVELYPTSETVWSLFIKHLMLSEQWRKADTQFNKALDKLGGNSLRVWDTYLTGLITTSDAEDIRAFFERAVKSPHEHIAAAMKAKYYLWTVLNRGYKNGRTLYNLLAESRPYSNELHREMYQIERISGNDAASADVIAGVLSLWQEQFGTVDKEVYLRRIEFIEQHVPEDSINRVKLVFRQAVEKLSDPKTVAAFKREYELYDSFRKHRI